MKFLKYILLLCYTSYITTSDLEQHKQRLPLLEVIEETQPSNTTTARPKETTNSAPMLLPGSADFFASRGTDSPTPAQARAERAHNGTTKHPALVQKKVYTDPTASSACFATLSAQENSAASLQQTKK